METSKKFEEYSEEYLNKKTHEDDDAFSVNTGEFVSKGETYKGNDSRALILRCAEQMISRNSQRSRSSVGTPEATGRKPATMDPSSHPDTPKSWRHQQKPVCGPVLPPDHPIAPKDSLARSKAEEETPDNSTEEVFDHFTMKTALPKPRNRLSLPSTASAGPLESLWRQKSHGNRMETAKKFEEYSEEYLNKKTHEDDDAFSVNDGEFVSKGETCKGNDSRALILSCAEQMISRNSQRSRSAGTPEATGRKPATVDLSSAPDTPKSWRHQQKPVCGPVLPPDHPIAPKDSLARSKAEEETPGNSTEEVFDYFKMKTALPKPVSRLSLPSTASAGPRESLWRQKSSQHANWPLNSPNFWQWKESTSAHVSPNTSVPLAESDCSDIYPTPPKSFGVKSTRWSTGSMNSMSTVPLSVQKFAGRYTGVTRPFIDSHCHIDLIFERSLFKGSYAKYRQVNEETFVPNYLGCIAVFCQPRKFTPYGGLWKDVLAEDNVWGAIGCHPKSATDFRLSEELALRAMVRHPKVKAVGEIGLDYSGTFARHRDVQKRVLVKQCEIALEMKMPIVIHSRDSEHDIIEVLEKVLPKNYKIHRHCFTGTWEEAEEWMRRFPNSYIGLTPLVTWRGQYRAHGPRDVAKRLPLNKLLLETDAPYFLPRCIYQNDMKHSHPGFAITVAEEVAWLKHCSVDEVLQQVLHNTCNMYDLEL